MINLGFGLMRLPLTDPQNRESINYEILNKMVDYYLENGFNYFDTGYPYHNGMSEVAAKKTLVERYPRNSFILADKMPTFAITCTDDYQRIFDLQQQRCGVDYFDYYLLHNLGEKNYANTVKFGGFEYMQKLKSNKKVGKIGFSFHDKADKLDQILTEHPEMEFVQLQINYIDWENVSIESRKCYEIARKHNKPIIVMETLKGGVLAKMPETADKLFKAYDKNVSPASWAIRYAASMDGVVTVLSGMSNIEQMIENVGFMKDFVPMNNNEREIILQVTEIMNNSVAISCTACQYCIDDCPKQIPIPQYFSLYNNQNLYGILPLHANYYMNLSQKSGKAIDCIECKQCEKHCPQHIKISDEMKKVSTIFDKK